MSISITKPDLYNINAQTKFGETPFMFTQVIIRKLNTDGQTDGRMTDGWEDRQMDRHTDVKLATIMIVVGYKKHMQTLQTQERGSLIRDPCCLTFQCVKQMYKK